MKLRLISLGHGDDHLFALLDHAQQFQEVSLRLFQHCRHAII
jgi:hypothetical protein